MGTTRQTAIEMHDALKQSPASEVILQAEHGRTYKTKLKLDKEVGGEGLSDLCTITYPIAYPYA